MALDLFTLKPSEPARLVRALRDGERLDELVSGLKEFLVRSSSGDSASRDLIFATAAQLSSAGVFEAVDLDDIGPALVGAPPDNVDIFLEAISPVAKASLRRFQRSANREVFFHIHHRTSVPSSTSQQVKHRTAFVPGTKSMPAKKQTGLRHAGSGKFVEVGLLKSGQVVAKKSAGPARPKRDLRAPKRNPTKSGKPSHTK